MKRVLIPGVILCGADVAQAVDDKNMYMHVFEEMTVYAPVPVPVNGNTHYTSESIERLPTREIFARRKSLFTVRRPTRMPI